MVAIPSIPSAPTICPGIAVGAVGIVLLYKDTPPLPSVPVTGASVKFMWWNSWKLGYETVLATVTGGILYEACIPKGAAVYVHASRPNIDFGSGIGSIHQVGYASGLTRGIGDYMFPPFKALTPVPCTSGTFPIQQSLSLPGTLKPQVRSGALPITAAGYDIPAKGMPFTIQVEGIEIGSGKITANQLTYTSLKPVTEIPEISGLLGKSVEVKAVINFGACEWVGITTAYLPAPPTPKEVICKAWETKPNVTVPPVLQPLSAIFVSGGNYVCKETGRTEPMNTIATVRIGSKVFNLEIRNGTGFLTLTRDDIAKLVG